MIKGYILLELGTGRKVRYVRDTVTDTYGVDTLYYGYEGPAYHNLNTLASDDMITDLNFDTNYDFTMIVDGAAAITLTVNVPKSTSIIRGNVEKVTFGNLVNKLNTISSSYGVRWRLINPDVICYSTNRTAVSELILSAGVSNDLFAAMGVTLPSATPCEVFDTQNGVGEIKGDYDSLVTSWTGAAGLLTWPEAVGDTSGYQECGLTGKTGATETGLAAATAYYFKMNVDAGGVSEFNITTDAATAGYQEVDVGGAKAGGTATGLATTTQYYFKVAHDGGAVVEYDITTDGVDVTYAAVIGLMNTATTGICTWSVPGDLRNTSDTTGSASSIALSAGTTGTDLYGALNDYVGFSTAVVGKTAIFTDVITDINTATTDAATWSLTGGDLRLTSDSAGYSSTIILSAGTSGTDLYATLTGFAAFNSPANGGAATILVRKNLDKSEAELAYISMSINKADIQAITVVEYEETDN